jgi:RNA polymerase sigma-70 factor, ECF subfamily
MPTYEKIAFNETQLIERLKTGSDAAYAELYDRYAAMLYGVTLRIVTDREDAENILQDTFVKIWNKIDTYDASKGRLATWLLNIARNTAIDFTRSKAFAHKQKNQDIDHLVSSTAAQPAVAINTDTIGLRQMVAHLPDNYREIIEGLYFNGYTQQEIADNFNIPLGTVKTRTRTALKELKTHFDVQ